MMSPWKEVSKRNRCLICEGKSWCKISLDGSTALCRRCSKGAFKTKTDILGTEFYLHKIGESKPKSTFIAQKVKGTLPTRDLNTGYEMILRHCTLEKSHLDELLNRGFSNEDIQLRNYKSNLDQTQRSYVAKELVKHFGIDFCRLVPGFVENKSDFCGEHTLFGARGILIPVRNTKREIIALKVRSDNSDSSQRYLYYSSSSFGGAGTGAPVHVPLYSDREIDTVRITEGELKADLATLKTGILTISIPGAMNFLTCIPVLEELGPRSILLSFDSDIFSNQRVAESLQSLFQILKQKHFTVGVELWK